MGGLTLTEERKEAQDYDISYNVVVVQRIFIEIHTKSARDYGRSFEDVRASPIPHVAARVYEHPYELAVAVTPRLIIGVSFERSYENALASIPVVCPPCPECPVTAIALWYGEVPYAIDITDPEIVLYIGHDLGSGLGDYITIADVDYSINAFSSIAESVS
jgi:hypothetical protein